MTGKPSWTLLLIFAPCFPSWFWKDAPLPQHKHTQAATQVAEVSKLSHIVSTNHNDNSTRMSDHLEPRSTQ